MKRISSVLFLLLPCVTSPVAAQVLNHPDPTLHYIYPAGGQQGRTVAVELGGLNGLAGAQGLLIDGPPGVTARDVKAVNAGKVQATLVIAADAVPGPRLVRVLGGANGLTGFRPFFVGRLPELLDEDKNDTPETAQQVTVPAVINARLNPALDVDCFAFPGRAGQRLVAAVLAHGMDSRLRSSGGHGGFLDTSLELLDPQGKVLAAAEDTLGLDPLIEYTLPADGRYVVRVRALAYAGAPGAVYRLLIGDIPYPTSMFPPGGQRGRPVEVVFTGPNVPPGSRRSVEMPGGSSLSWDTVGWDHPATDGRVLPFVWGNHPETVETEPNDTTTHAVSLSLPVTVNGRFDRTSDEDWYHVRLRKGEGVLIEVTAQRHLRSPIDTLVQVFDSAGKLLTENDDGPMFAGQCEHDFPSADSYLEFTAPADGDYHIRLTDQSGASGPTAVYRLTVEPLRPDFRLFVWPDAVPIWGPGTTAAFVVQVQRWGGLTADIRLAIEGLPAGWVGSAGYLSASNYQPPRHGLNQKGLLTITAPTDAPVGTTAPFRVVGVAQEKDNSIRREAQPLTLFGSSHTDRMHLRVSPIARAVVAPPLDCRLETPGRELTVVQRGTVQVPVRIHRRDPVKGDMGISIDGETPGAGSGWRVPLTLKRDQNEVQLPLDVGDRRPGTYGIVVSRSWAADLRAGRPGPCTPLILLHIQPAEPGRK